MKYFCFIAYKLKRILGKKQIKLATANILERETKEMWASFGTWDESYQEISTYLLRIAREPSGKETIRITNSSAVGRRLFWTGDLSRNYYVSFGELWARI